MATLIVRDVVKDFGAFRALNGVSFEVADGEFISLLGPSGCGKTTLLRTIAGLEELSGGEIEVAGKVVSRSGFSVPPERRDMGLVFQSYALWPHMNVFDNIAYGLRLKKMDRRSIAARVSEVLELVGLVGAEKRWPAEMSGGQRQRVAVARSVALEPRVLLFDEPLSNLDAKLRERMRMDLRRMQQETGITAVYVTHDQAEAMVISDRVILMSDGEIVQEGTPAGLYQHPRTIFAADFLGSCNFIPATVLDPQTGPDRHIRVALANGVELLAQADEGFAAGDDAVVAIRPEAVRGSDRPEEREHGEASADNMLQGSVGLVVYAGGLSEVHYDIGLDLPVRSQVFSRTATWIDEGVPAWLHIAPRDVRVLPRDGAGARPADDLTGVGAPAAAAVTETSEVPSGIH